MIKKLIFVSVLLFSLNFYAQIHFEKGYFITNSNVKVECYIRNSDWRDNPTRFLYKTSENESATEEKNIDEVKEFGIGEFYKFERFEGLVDDSSFNLNEMSDHKEPTWIKKTIFLKVIIQGNAKLYNYADGNTTKYFYSNNGSPVEQLVYKKYTEDNVTIKINNFFQQQLYTKVKCESVPLSEIFKIKYTEEDLSNYFLKANNSSADKDLAVKTIDVAKTFDKRNKTKRDNFLLKAKAGIDFSSLAIDYSFPDAYGNESKAYPDFEFDGKQTFRVGFETEYVLPTNSNKWSIFFELAYQSKYESQKTVQEVYYYSYKVEKHWKVSYKSFDLGLGFRHYMFLNNNSKLFLNASLMLSPHSGSMLASESNELVLRSKPYLGLGLGYAYKRYNIEFRYSSRNILEDYYYVKSKYKDLSVVLGYTLFESNKKN